MKLAQLARGADQDPCCALRDSGTVGEIMTLDEIWNGDLFDRRNAATLLLAYIESLGDRAFKRDDKQAYTIAVEAPYGAGKTYFLKRLAEQIGLDHPVAFVDAWADDLADEPLTALAATLEEALEPYLSNPGAQQRMKDFWAKTSTVTKLVAKGLVKRGAALLLTEGVVDELADIALDASKEARDAALRQVGDVAKGFTEDVSEGLGKSSLMEERVADFRKGKKAVAAMKASLTAVIDSLALGDKSPPIIIVIDELDRCRPTYALKLLEEIKHLFDVPGLVFCLGINAEQLAHSVSGAYGPGFDGRAYLSRFVDREYHLPLPALEPLVQQLCERAGINLQRYDIYRMYTTYGDQIDASLSSQISVYLDSYGMTARDAFKVIDLLQTCQAVSKSVLLLAYLMPLIIGHVKGLKRGEIPVPKEGLDLVYRIPKTRYGEGEDIPFGEVPNLFLEASRMDSMQLSTYVESTGTFSPAASVYRSRGMAYGDNIPIWAVERYPDLVRSVARFANPKLAEETA